MSVESQNQVVLAHLKNIGPLTQWGAIRHYKITRLGARIYDLQGAGQKIRRRWIENAGKRFKEYSLA